MEKPQKSVISINSGVQLSMIHKFKIETIQGVPNFESKFWLEEFCIQNLEALFGFIFLGRQVCIEGQYCDIFALDRENKLVILELKVTEDRYIVQQLTRYYDAALKHQLFQDQVDYTQSIRVIALAPRFHRDTLTDLKYSTLNIELCSYTIETKDNETFDFLMRDLTGKISERIPIATVPLSESPSSVEISPPSQFFLKTITKFKSDQNISPILHIREKILSFHPRMKEFQEQKRWTYSRGKSIKPCAIIQAGTSRKLPHVFINSVNLLLYLPDLMWTGSSYKVSPVHIFTSDYLRFSGSGMSVYGQDGMLYTQRWQDDHNSIYLKLCEIEEFLIQGKVKDSSDSLIGDLSSLDREILEKVYHCHAPVIQRWGDLDALIDVALQAWAQNL